MIGTRVRIAAIVAALGLVVAACGTAAASGETASTSTTMASMDHEHDMGAMNMGDADATAAYDIDGAEVASGVFAPVDGADTGAGGSAWLARHGDGTTVTIELTGLGAGAGYIAHVHDEPCVDGGGAHYQFSPGGDHHPPNEIHLAFTAMPGGMGSMTAENEQVADERAVSVVVHEAIDGAPKLVCADLVAEG